ncbi:MAG: hypothetical protein PWR20_1653 [Bacteroidales bacterium]|jgi:gliding motility-associated-like protein|nr:hypothetical protein [Bacteroidales bacterium]MDN5330593.1 hypothetical protein [Bacteroidales bacterium]
MKKIYKPIIIKLPARKAYIAFIFLLFSGFSNAQTTYYWVGGQGEWSDVTHWATTSGGNTHPAAPPTMNDNVVFDNNSFNNGDTVFIVNNLGLCADMTWNTTRWVTLYSTQPLEIYGSFTWSNTVQANLSGNLYFLATSPGKTIDTKGVELGGTVYFNGIGGEWTLLSSLEVFVFIYLQAGTLNTNNQAVRAMHFYATSNVPRTLNLGNSVFTCTLHSPTSGYSWQVEYSSSFTLITGGSSLIRFTADGTSRMKAGDGLNYDNIIFAGKGILISNNSTYKDVQFGTYKPGNPSNNYTGRIGEGLTLSNNNTFNNVTFFDHGYIHGNNNTITQNLQFRGNGNILSGSNQCHTLQQYRYYPYFGGTTPNTLTLEAGETQTILNTIELIGTILCEHTVITSTESTHANVFTTYPITLEYVDLRYLHGKNTPDPTGSGIAPDTAWTSLNTNNINWLFPDNYHLPRVDSATVVDVSPCHNSTNGVITVHASGGLQSSRLQYQITGPVNRTWQDDSVFTSLPQGLYTILVREVRGIAPTEEVCFVSDSIAISVGGPEPLSIISIDVVDPLCYGGCDGSLTIHATGGTRPYEFSINWDPLNQTGTFQSDSTFNNLCAGTFNTLMVRHSNVCYASSMPSATLNNPPDIIITSSNITPISCNDANDGQIQVTASGGTGTLTYTLSPGSVSNNTGIFTNLAPGTYTVEVTDSHNCIETTGPFVFTNPPLLEIISEQTTDITCHDANDGTITIETTGGTGTKTYTLNPGGTFNNTGFFTGLGQGTYTVTVTDTNGCLATSNPLTISNPPALSFLSIISTDITCHNYNNGTISVSATGGTGGLSYTLNPLNYTNTSGNFINLVPGTYTITVSDENNCQLTSPNITITNPSPVVVSTSEIPASCYGVADGCAIASATGGAGSYSFTWTSITPQVVNDSLCGVSAGIYTVSVTDANGCQATDFAIVTQPTAIAVTFNTAGYANPSPPPDYLYSAQALPTGGTPPYTHHWETGEMTDQIVDVIEGIYTDTISDANGCIKIDSVYLQALSCQIAAFQNVTCNGANNGSALAQGVGGNTPYSYQWREQGDPTILGTNALIEGLAPGTYEVTITDANNISVICSVTITEPPLLQVSLTPISPACNGQNGTIQSNTIGGTPFTVPPASYNYNYLWSNLETTPDINALAGNYSLTVTDSLGCQATASTMLTEPPAISIVSITKQDISCHDANDGTITVSASGGTGDLNYTLNPGGNSNNTGIFNNLPAGTYSVDVTDVNGCSANTGPIIIINPEAISIASSSINNITCYNANDGSISISATGGTGTLTYTLNPGGIVNNSGLFTGLSAGTYTITITDINSCSFTSPDYTIINPEEITITSLISEDPLCHNGSDGSITVQASGGTGTLTYTLNPSNISNQTGLFSGLVSGTYTVTIKDVNNCQITSGDIILNNPNLLVVSSISKTDMTCHNIVDGTITVIASGGTGAYTYTLYPDVTINFTGYFTGLDEGDYVVRVNDANNCEAWSDTLHIINPDTIHIIDEAYSNPLCAGANNGTITITALGGTTPLTYWLQPGSIPYTNGTITGLAPGSYTVIVTDINLCPSDTSSTFNLIDPPAIEILSESFTPITCHNAADGTIEIIATGGTGTLNYTLNPLNITNQTGLFTNLNAGTYSVTVSDQNGCSINSSTFILTNPPAVSIASVYFNQPLCYGVNNGSITINASGGTGSLYYSINGGVTYSANSVFTELGPGFYNIYVSDDNGCYTVYNLNPVQLVYPPQLTLSFNTQNPTCNGCTDGSITAIPAGGTPGYSHHWNNGATTATITGLPANIYFVDTVTDANGCIVIDSTLLSEPGQFVVSTQSSNVSCYGGNNGWIQTSVSGGTAPYSYAWKKEPNPVIYSTSPNLFDLEAGVYTLTVLDAFGYAVYDTVEITQPAQLVVTLSTSHDSLCPESQAGWITAQVSGGTPSYSYLWSGGSSMPAHPDSIFNLAPGTYSVFVTDAQGCQQSALATIDAYSSPQAVFTVSPACLGNPNQFDDQSIPGSASISSWFYTFGDGQTQQVNAPNSPDISYTYSNPGSYTASLVTIDLNGCISNTATFNVLVNPIPSAAFTFDTVCFNLPTQFTDLSNSFTGLTSWEWDFGDGSSNQQHPQHIFLTYGIHSVKLIVADAIGCSDSITHNVTVWPLPLPDFTYTDSCTGTTLWFTDQSDPQATGITSWQWDFGDGYYSTLQNPQHTFTLPNTIYPVTLTTVNTNGCQNSITQNVLTATNLGANFTFNTACHGDTTYFWGTSNLNSGEISQITWYFGDGSSATGNPVSHIYSSPGYYNVIMQLESTSGCEQTVSQIISVIALPQPAFSWVSGCPGDTTSFTDLSVGLMSPIVSWLWDFGDGNQSNVQHPIHAFANPGIYAVSLTVVNANGCTATIQHNVTIDPAPLALFTWNGICEGAATQFTDQSNGNSYPINQWFWNFGDGWFSSLQNPTHTFPSAGTYNVNLQVWNSYGCTNDTTLQVTIHPNPVAWFSADTVCAGSYTSFSDESTSAVSITNWLWNFGDGDTSYLQHPQHTYASVGPFNVELTVTDANGCVDTVTRPVINYPKPLAAFTYTAACTGNALQFTDASLGNGGNITNWQWDFGDGNQSILQNPQHVYNTFGNYTVTLIVTTENGCSDTVVQTVSPFNPPTSDFTWTSPCVLTATQFIDLSTQGSSNIVNYLWTIDNIWNSILQNPTYSFTTIGTHSVRLVVTDENGCQDTLEQNLLIDSLPVADFAWDIECANVPTQFTDFSNPTGSIIASWNWSFGDGDTSYLQHPAHLYGQGGFYTVNLTVAKPNGCSATATRTVVIDSIPVANFTYDTACVGLPTFFYDLTNVYGYPVVQYSWDFGDPASGAANHSSLQNPEHIYSAIGSYDVTLIVTNAIGCTDTIIKQINTFPSPVADFTYDTACHGQPTQLTDLTTSISPVVSWQWDLGGGNSSSLQNPVYTFPNYGLNSVTLTITNQNGCIASITKDVLVDQLPIAGFTWSNPCNTNIVQFTDTSIVTTTPITSWLWDFGDGSFSSVQNPQHVFAPNQSYNVTLTVNTQAGCSNTHSKSISIAPEWNVDFTFDTVCLGDSMQFAAQVLTPGVNVALVEWNFGDGTVDTGSSIKHLYTLAGQYQVTMQITDTAGCTQGASHLVTVNSLPQPAFTFESTCSDSTVSFFDQTAGSITSWLWDFGDGNSSTQQNPQHLYTSSGTYPVTLQVINSNGCQNETSQLLILFDKPTADFTANNACLGSPTQFTDLSTTLSGSIVTWNWNFGDGGQSNLQNPQHIYANPGTYLVTLVVSNSLGCADSSLLPVQVLPLPEAGFTFSNACLGSGTQFTDQSSTTNGVISNWLWNFGDGNSSNQQNPIHTFVFAGTFNTSLTITDSAGCQATYTQPVEVLPLPTADFSFTDNFCGNTEVQFTDLSSGNGSAITTWYWDFGDGDTSALQNPTHLYASPGNYTVSLQVTNANNCVGTLTKPLLIGTPPVAAFSYTNNCYPQATQFTDLSSTTSGNIVQWEWNFGDPSSGASNTSNQQHPMHTFSAPGNYAVTLIITTSANCTDTVWQSLSVEPGPTADFSFSTACVGNTTSFTDLSIAAGYPITSWVWDFGDGNTSSQQNPIHTFLFGGQYMVTLTVTDSNGCQSSHTQMVPVYNLPTAQFAFSNECEGQYTYFTDYSNGAGAAITSWVWDFGDPLSGGNNYSTLQNPSHTFNSTGLYQVTLNVTNANGCSNSITQPVLVIPSPVADFEADTACSGSPVFFNNLSYSVGSSINQWYWDFGDGTTSTLQFPYHTFPGPGVYNVSLTVTNANGCTASVLKQVTVNHLPVVSFDYLRPNCEGDSTHFINLTSFAGGGGAASYLWNFGDGTTSTFTSPVHLYPSSGIYTVTLTVMDNNGCTAANTNNVKVYNSPNAAFIFNNINCSDVQFTDMSYDPELAINSWYWDFNDPGSGTANQSTLQNPLHTFSQPGNFAVQLMVVNTEGCSDTATRNVEVSAPVADFRVDSSTLCAGASTQFIDLSYSNYGTITSWLWDFGDGSTSTLPNPIHSFANGGSYWISLTIQTSLGCQSSITKQVNINNSPIANFNFNTPNCPEQAIGFNDLSSPAAGATIIGWNWNFGDGSTSTLQNPVHTFTTAGNYQVQLQVTDNRGCQANIIRSVKVYSQPVANFSQTISNCNVVSFNDLSLSQDTIINAWLWNFGDSASGFNNFSTLKNPVHTYNQPGTYAVNLIVWTAAGCSDTLTRNISIVAPIADFTWTAGCQGDLTQFSDLSQSNGVPITQWLWQFGDGGTSISQNPVHSYTYSGTYLVSLLVTNSLGCQSNVVQQVAIPASPLADFTFDTPCLGDSTHFMDASLPAGNTPITSWYWDFGDGSSSLLRNPSHLYAASGTFNVTLQVTDTNGCISTHNQQVTIFEKPLANFIYSIPNCDTVFFTDASAGGGSPLALWQWNFGDPASGMFNSSTQQNPWHVYTLPGTYQVRLIVTNLNGCSDTILQPVVFDPFPQPDFTFDTACSGDTTHFLALNTAPNIVNYDWDFGDGFTGSGPAPVHVYTNAGTYSVTLVVTNNNLCTNYFTKAVTVIPTPNVNFTWNPVTCEGAEVSFINQTQGNGGSTSQYLWKFGDGTTSNLLNPSHTYATAGNYQVTLIAWNSNGCLDSLQKIITIHPLPVAAFETDTVCNGLPTQFTDLSQPQGSPITDWQWTFGDGTSLSGIQNPQHLYAQAGSYNASLTITAANGCQTTTADTVLVNFLPVANFTIQSDTLCAQDTVFFTNLSSPQTGTSYFWIFGDPTSGTADTSTQANPYHVYNQPGNYTITLISTTGSGCQHDTTKTITIRTKPEVNFIYTVACANDTTFFTDLSYMPDGTAVNTWTWNFGDGSSSTLQNPEHVYANVVNDTTFSVTLTAGSSFGCNASQTQQVPVYGPPTAAFSAPSVCQGTVTYFTTQSTTPSGIITSWQWDFGDSTFSTLPNPTHLYAQADTFMVSLIVGNSNGCFDTVVQPVVVYPLPLPDFAYDTVCFGDTTHFVDMTLLPYGEINSWFWTFGDPMSGVYDTSSLQNPSHKFTHPGIFMVTLMAGDTNGCSDYITLPVKVDSLPLPEFQHTAATCQNTAIAFTDQSQTTDNPIASWTWWFGDGNDTTIYAPNSPNVEHVYTNLGLYTATLITTDIRGCTDSVSHILEIYPLPQAAFSYKDTTCTAGLIYFKDQSIGVGTDVTGWLWDFNYPGQSYSTQQNPYYFYPITNANYTVMLTVTDARGCTDTIFDTIYVKPDLQVDFALQNNCYGDTVIFTPLVIQPAGDTIVQAEWTYGDGQTSTSLIGTHIYSNPGMYYVQMKGWNQNGCLATAFKPIIVDAPPLVAFSAPPAGCLDPTIFIDFSQPNSDSVVSWYWQFGDGSDTMIFAPGSPNVIHNYGEEGGIYQATLTVTNSNGCSATLNQEVIRYSCLQAGFNVNTLVCSGQPVTIIDNSAAGSGAVTITNWFWDLGDGTQFNSPTRLDTIVHTYSQHGTYTIRQIITANTGSILYMDTAEVSITVYPGPVASFIHTPGCLGVPVVFKDQTATPGAPLTQWFWNFGDGTSDTVQNPVHQFADTSAYLVVLSVTNTFGCTDTASALIKPAVLPGAILAAPDTVFCADTLTLTLSEISNQQAYRYVWNFGDGTTTETDIPQAKHTFAAGTWDVILTVYSNAECPNSDTLQLTLHSLPVVEFTFKPDSIKARFEEARFLDASFGTSSPITQWHWDFGDGYDTLATNPTHIFADTGNYVVALTVTDQNGCSNTLMKNVRVYPELRFFIPNAFSPNHNGRNDVFKPMGKYFKPDRYLFQIYNRWGELIFETTDPEQGWDGTFKGVESPVGVYIWVVTVYDMFNDKEYYKGSVLLLR